MPFCPCGELILGAKCLKCGRSADAAIAPGTTAPSGVGTSTVAGSSKKWNTFETNYQRSKGITTEESMNEIAQYVDEGTAQDEQGDVDMKRAEVSALGNDLTSVMARNGIKGNDLVRNFKGTKPAVVGTGKPGKTTTTTTTTETQFTVDGGVQKAGPIAHSNASLNAKTNSAAGFLDQWKSNDAAKYKPGYANKNGGVL